MTPDGQRPDLRLLHALADGVMSGEQEAAILDVYAGARRRGGTRREMKTIVEHVEFFRVQLQRMPTEKVFAIDLRAALERLRTGIDALQD